MQLLEKVSEEKEKPEEGLEVLTDVGKRYYFKKSGWCRWSETMQEYVPSNTNVGHWYKPLPLNETKMSAEEEIYDAVGSGYGFNGIKEECLLIIRKILQKHYPVLYKDLSVGFAKFLESAYAYEEIVRVGCQSGRTLTTEELFDVYINQIKNK